MKKRKLNFSKQWKFNKEQEIKKQYFLSHTDELSTKKEYKIKLDLSQLSEKLVMTTLKEIDAQLAALQAQREQIRKSELKTTVDKVRSLVAEYGLTESDVFPPARGARSTATAGTKVAPKYRDPATGATWTGRGKAPKWIEGQEREKFAI